MNGDDWQGVDRHNPGERSREIVPPLHQLGEERVSLGGGRSVSWLSLQVILFFVACLICACCAISSYVWSDVSSQLTPPAFLLPEESHTPTPTWTQSPTEPGAPITPTQTPAPGATSPSPIRTPTPAPEPTATTQALEPSRIHPGSTSSTWRSTPYATTPAVLCQLPG
jgi:hypothetical protein